MAQVDQRLLIQIDAATAAMRSQLAAADDRIQRFTRNTDTRLQRVDKAFQRAQRSVGVMQAALIGLGGGMAFRGLVGSINTMGRLEGQLKLVTSSAENLAEVQEKLFRVAQETYTSYDGTVQLYARLARNTRELGVSQDQLLQFTQSTNQAMMISGASAQEAASGILQLSQALASGELRGEELRSVMENTPRLARAIADGLDVNIGKLRDMAAEGLLTTDKVFSAILSQTEKVQSEFEKMPRRVDQAMTQLQNQLLETFGRSNAQPLVDAVDELRDMLTDPAVAEGLQSLAAAAIKLTGWLAKAAGYVTNITKFFSESLAAQVGGAALGDIPRLEDQLERLRELRQTSEYSPERMASFGDNGGMGYQNYISNDEIDSQIKKLEQRLQLSYEFAESEGNVGSLPAIDVLAPKPPAGNGGAGKVKRQVIDVPQRPAISTEFDRDREALEEIRESLKSQEQLVNESYDRRIDIVRRSVGDQAEASRMINGLERQRLGELESLSSDTYSEMSAFAEQAARNIQDELGDTLRDTLSGDFDGILDSWTNMLLDMAAQAQAAQLGKLLLGDFGADGGKGKMGGLLGTIGTSLAGSLGGMFGGGGVSAASSGQSLADAGIGGAFGQFLGGRANGGPTASGGMYEINERGIPEVLTSGGKDFLMMGSQSGYVTPAQPAVAAPAANSSPMRVEINNYGSPDAVRSEQGKDGDGTQVLKLFVNEFQRDMAQRGPMSRSMQNTFPQMKRSGS